VAEYQVQRRAKDGMCAPVVVGVYAAQQPASVRGHDHRVEYDGHVPVAHTVPHAVSGQWAVGTECRGREGTVSTLAAWVHEEVDRCLVDLRQPVERAHLHSL
jgi:hypothetical protein